jgi:hypothetical protein
MDLLCTFDKIFEKRLTFLHALHVDTSWNTLGLKDDLNVSTHAQFRDACACGFLSAPEDHPVKRVISCCLNSLPVAHRDNYGLPAQAWTVQANRTGRLSVCSAL